MGRLPPFLLSVTGLFYGENTMLKTCLKCGKDFYKEGEFKTHIQQCVGKTASSFSEPKSVTAHEAEAGVPIVPAPANLEPAKPNKKELRDALIVEAKKYGVSNPTIMKSADLQAAIDAAKAKEQTEVKE